MLLIPLFYCAVFVFVFCACVYFELEDREIIITTTTATTTTKEDYSSPSLLRPPIIAPRWPAQAWLLFSGVL